MMARKSLQKSLQLGRAVEWPDSPEKAKLDRVPNPQADTNYLVRFTAPEFTSICPVTGQPDFGILVIDYLPGEWLVESKSLKLYLWRFRDEPVFAEALAAEIAQEILGSARPRRVTVTLTQRPRGGITVEAVADLAGG